MGKAELTIVPRSTLSTRELDVMGWQEFKVLYRYLVHNIKDCSDTLVGTYNWLRLHGYVVDDNLIKIIDLGGHCDCEVLMNVTPGLYRLGMNKPLALLDTFDDDEAEKYVNALIGLALGVIDGTYVEGDDVPFPDTDTSMLTVVHDEQKDGE